MTINYVKTNKLSLEVIDKNRYSFTVPSYQRPYVWPEEAVLKLLDDIDQSRKNEEGSYFVGTVLTSLSTDKDHYKTFQLIDGQQRITTLVLLAIAFGESCIKRKMNTLPIVNLAEFNRKPRLKFKIRDQVQQLLGSYIKLPNCQYPGDKAVAANPYLTSINAALVVLRQQVNALNNDDFKKLADYVYQNVVWINNTVPQEMDLNRLFAAMNTAGIQLEPVDLLKAQIFKGIKTEKPLFNAIWTACEHMENYFERNVRKLFPEAPWENIEYSDLSEFNKNLFTKNSKDTKSETNKNGLTVKEIVDKKKQEDYQNIYTKSEFKVYELEQETVYCRPIISFSLLLIHTLRIHFALSSEDDKKDILTRVHKDKLLETFKDFIKSDEADLKAFILRLWQVRHQFDKWIIKWIERDDSNDEQLRLTYLSKSQSNGKWYINRTQKEHNALEMLQSARNFTGERSAQYWITPFLAKLTITNPEEESDVLSVLEKIDNQLSLAGEQETQKTASFKIAQNILPEQYSFNWLKNKLEAPNGTSFEHYWFQKVEYLLWKNEKERDQQEFRKFRITNKNSVEHVLPIHEEHQNRLAHEDLNSFGNLVLLSPSENSSYKHQAVEKKFVDFHAKPYYDSLKLKSILELFVASNRTWGSSQIKKHRKNIIKILKSHYKKDLN